MKITNFGSCCIDNVYAVPYFVKPGETLPCTDYQVHPGGKGLNQSLALAHAGANVRHAGKLGREGMWMKDLLTEAGVDTAQLQVVDEPCGHALIQVTPEGENAIVLFGGANKAIGVEDIDAGLADAAPGDFLLLQNEISSMSLLLEAASKKDQRIIFNAAPMSEAVLAYPLESIEMFIVNEVEGAALTGADAPDAILDVMGSKFPRAKTILTLGDQGAIYSDRETRIHQAAFKVEVVDATAAGDTFTGYFLAAFASGTGISECLEIACRAAATCVTKPGAASSIPRREELDLVSN